jgi:uncharacterized damage-inducible protein DinB
MRATATLGLLFAFVITLSLAGQTREGVMGELLRDVNTAQAKIVGLAKAIPDGAYDWRPGKAVRSTREVLMHVAADNYFMPTLQGTAAPSETGITKEYSTAEAFEKRTMTRDQIIAELDKSFDFLKTSMSSTPDAKLDAPPEPGRKNSVRGLWISTATHLHEHLGQLIAYARSNNVTPPWSK